MLPLFLASALAQDLGEWHPSGLSGVVCIHTAVLPNNKLLCFERPHMPPYGINPNTNGRLSTEIDLMAQVNSDGTWTASYKTIAVVNNPFCAGHAQMADGNILVIGGDRQQMSDDSGMYVTNGVQGRRSFNVKTSEWVTYEDMTSARWYPTVVTLSDGSAIIFGGSTKNLDFDDLRPATDNNPTYEYFPPKSGSWPRELQILRWAFPHSLYPMSFLLPSGKVFLFVSNKTLTINPKTEEIINLADIPSNDHAPWIYPHSPTMTFLPLTIKNNFKVTLQVCGGSQYEAGTMKAISSAMCYQFNPDDANPTWKRIQDMPHARVMVDSCILPDGTILYVNGLAKGVAGGNQGQVQYASEPVYATDLFDPNAPEGSQWTTLAPFKQKRLYHSGVVLLETGHVMTMGSEFDNYDDYWVRNQTECWPYNDKPACTDPFNYNLERFSPPYLQKAARQGRPVILTVPEKLTPKSTFEIKMETDGNKVERISFIRYSTTTHQTNTDQRFIELKILYKSASSIIIEAPIDTNQAPPGNWMLFALDKDNIPSVAKTINFQNGPATTVPGFNSSSIRLGGVSWLSVLCGLLAFLF